MSGADQARVTMAVRATPERAFSVFSGEIDRWWQRGPRFRNAPGEQGIMCLEPRLGGRVFESHRTDDQESVIEIGRITAWEPPHRLCFTWRASNFAAGETTQVEILFAAQANGTLITVTHRGWGAIRPDHPARHGQDDRAFLRGLGSWWADQFRALDAALGASDGS